MTLVANWRRVLLRAWSVRFILAALILSGVEVALPYLDGILPVGRGTFALLSFAATAGAGIARIVAQSDVDEVRS